jgi:fatty acid desaturase
MEAETKGQWYFRQILGSSNFEGSLLMHIMSGHLSHQIEHHLYPDLPAWRYRELGPKVEEICGRYGIPYQKGKMVPMLKTVASSIVKYSVPDVVSQKLGRFFKSKRVVTTTKHDNVEKLRNKKSSNEILEQKNGHKDAKAA